MFGKLFKIIFGDRSSKLKNKINKKYAKAIQFQRNGNIRMYSETMAEIESLESELIKIDE